MQVGEPVSVAPPSTPPDDVEFEAELVSVTFKSTLKTSHAKATINGPQGAIQGVRISSPPK